MRTRYVTLFVQAVPEVHGTTIGACSVHKSSEKVFV
jgi:hypothetical protein